MEIVVAEDQVWISIWFSIGKHLQSIRPFKIQCGDCDEPTIFCIPAKTQLTQNSTSVNISIKCY